MTPAHAISFLVDVDVLSSRQARRHHGEAAHGESDRTARIRVVYAPVGQANTPASDEPLSEQQVGGNRTTSMTLPGTEWTRRERPRTSPPSVGVCAYVSTRAT